MSKVKVKILKIKNPQGKATKNIDDLLSSDNESEEVQVTKKTAKNGKKPVKKVSVDESSDEDQKLLTKKKAVSPKPDKKVAKKKAVESDSDSDIAPPQKGKGKAPVKKPVAADSDSDEPVQKKPVQKKKKQQNSDDEDSVNF